ncbi:MAG: adenylate/guanylate cyclase domain-containing protein, partial [Bacteroidota bacterium]
GANDYLTKPVSRQELLARIKTHLNLRHINTAYGKFVPREFLTSLGHDSILDARLGDGVEKEFTVFFSDIRSYTTISEQMTPKENFDFLNAYLGRVGPIIKKKYGFVNQYFGDGIMALFPRKAADAVQAAISIQKTLDSYNEERLAKNRIPVHVGIGLHTGPLMMGIIGDSMRMDAAVVSDTVNTASRMEGLTKHYHSRIIISEDTFKGLEEPQKIHHRFLGKVVVKGRKGVLGIYDVFEGDREEIAVQKMDSLSVFEQAVDAYYEKNFKEAMQAFQEVLGIFPTDQNAKNYLQKIEQLSADNLPETWDGVERFVSK